MSDYRYLFILSLLFDIMGKVEHSDVWSAVFFILSILLGILAVISYFKGEANPS